MRFLEVIFEAKKASLEKWFFSGFGYILPSSHNNNISLILADGI